LPSDFYDIPYNEHDDQHGRYVDRIVDVEHNELDEHNRSDHNRYFRGDNASYDLDRGLHHYECSVDDIDESGGIDKQHHLNRPDVEFNDDGSVHINRPGNYFVTDDIDGNAVHVYHVDRDAHYYAPGCAPA